MFARNPAQLQELGAEYDRAIIDASLAIDVHRARSVVSALDGASDSRVEVLGTTDDQERRPRTGTEVDKDGRPAVPFDAYMLLRRRVRRHEHGEDLGSFSVSTIFGVPSPSSSADSVPDNDV